LGAEDAFVIAPTEAAATRGVDLGYRQIALVAPDNPGVRRPLGDLFFLGSEVDRLALEHIQKRWPEIAREQGYTDELQVIPVLVPDA
jgi:hypothetical protein